MFSLLVWRCLIFYFVILCRTIHVFLLCCRIHIDIFSFFFFVFISKFQQLTILTTSFIYFLFFTTNSVSPTTPTMAIGLNFYIISSMSWYYAYRKLQTHAMHFDYLVHVTIFLLSFWSDVSSSILEASGQFLTFVILCRGIRVRPLRCRIITWVFHANVSCRSFIGILVTVSLLRLLGHLSVF